MLDGFDVTTIPATYADAITVTKRLGIRFLWIDSFCIIQNDHDDWLAESQKMGKIYENAYLNIAATGANDGRSGFLRTREEDPVYVRVPSAAGQRKYDRCSTGVGQFYFTNQADSNFDTFVTRAKLNTRGWVLQERILSRRSVHFAADMWYWECGRHIISEDGWQHEVKHTDKPPPYSTTSRRQALDANVTAIGKFFQYDNHEYGTDDDYDNGTDISSQSVLESEVLWAQILRAYSRCDLTFSSDKLPALQGLVDRFKQTAQRPYVFGHWIQAGEPLPLSLMWFAANDGGLNFPADKLAPSWSCLKGNGAIAFHDTRAGTPCTEIDRVDGDWPSIRLRGRLRAAMTADPNGERRAEKPTFYALSFKYESDHGTITRFVGPARFDDAANIPGEVTLLLAYKMKRHHSSSQDVTQPALMLEEIGGAESKATEIVDGEGGKDVKRYKRIGIANIKNHDFFDGVAVSSVMIV